MEGASRFFPHFSLAAPGLKPNVQTCSLLKSGGLLPEIQVDLEPTASTGILSLRDSFFLC